jgi:hypothetical protein
MAEAYGDTVVWFFKLLVFTFFITTTNGSNCGCIIVLVIWLVCSSVSVELPPPFHLAKSMLICHESYLPLAAWGAKDLDVQKSSPLQVVVDVG